MYVVFLEFSNRRELARDFMEAHTQWIDQGFEDGVFLLSGRFQGGLGGGILAHGTTLLELERRVQADPFVANDVVSARIFEISPARTDERLAFLRE